MFVRLTQVARVRREGPDSEQMAYVNPDAIDVILIVQPGSTRLLLREGGADGYLDVRESPEDILRACQSAKTLAREEKGEKGPV